MRPLLRRAFQPQQQQQNQARSHASRQQAQQQKAAGQVHDTGKQQPLQGSDSQGQGGGLHSSEPASSQASQTPAIFKQQAQSGDQDPQTDSASVCGDAQSVDPAAQAQQGASNQLRSTETSARSQKSKKGKKTKKDYAAWAGATAETRAVAKAYLEGNPDIADNSQPLHAGVKGVLLLTDS